MPTGGMIDMSESLAFCLSALSFIMSFLSSQSPCPITGTGIGGPVLEVRNLGLRKGEQLARWTNCHNKQLRNLSGLAP